MIRVLVAEDEPPILKSVCRNIEKAHSQFTVIKQVYNGREAREYLEKEGDDVDVLVTDINMPVENGLKLLDYAARKFPNIITVVLSGYQEFEYARQALKSGVIDYLSKPIDRDQLRSLLARISDIVEAGRTENLRQILFEALQSPPSVEPPAAEGKQFSLALACSGPFPVSEYDYLLPGRDFWDHHNLAGLAADHFGKQDYWVVPGKCSVEELLLIPALPDEGCRLVKSLFQSIDHLDGPPITLCFAPGPFALKELAAAYHGIRKELHRSVIVGRSSFRECNNGSAAETEDIRYKELFEGVREDVISKSNEDLLTAILALINDVLGKAPRQVNLEEFLAFAFTTLVNTAADARNYRDIEATINSLITNSSGTDELLEGARDLLSDVLLPSGPRQQERDRKIEEMADYLALNYNQPVSNSTLSARFGMVPSYVSSIFKSQMGVTPSEYIRDIRMERARELLGENRNLRLKDIAAMVGYSDPLYFSRVFKKHYGTNPSRVRNQTPDKAQD